MKIEWTDDAIGAALAADFEGVTERKGLGPAMAAALDAAIAEMVATGRARVGNAWTPMLGDLPSSDWMATTSHAEPPDRVFETLIIRVKP
jgi:hypothetical protein